MMSEGVADAVPVDFQNRPPVPRKLAETCLAKLLKLLRQVRLLEAEFAFKPTDGKFTDQ